MARVDANSIELEYESRGEGDPVVLIMGIGAQLVHWPDTFVDLLAAEGFRVIRFDNRDCGRSTWFDDAGTPDVPRMLARWVVGLPVRAPYSLADMSDDVAGLLDGLGIDRAHIVGVSMGGMIAQALAIRHPRRVRSLTSIMSTTGQRTLLVGRPRAVAALLGSPPRNEEEAGEKLLALFHVVGAPAFPEDEEGVRSIGRLAFRRGHHPQGFQRQFAAVLAAGSRRRALADVQAPTLVVHGTADPLLPLSGGRATAKAIPNARFEPIEGLGHSLPPGVHRLLVSMIAEHARGAGPDWKSRRVVAP